MIIAKITSGLGNQLFQYAFARHLSIINHTDLYFDLRFYHSTYSKQSQRNFKLDHFNIEYKKMNIPMEYLTKATKLFPKRSCKPFFNLSKEEQYHFNSNILQSKAYTITTEGYWHSEKYFSAIDPIIRKELTFNNTPSPSFEWYKQQIENAVNPISVHIRRGDYVTHPVFSETFGFLGLDYYKKAMELIEEKITSFTFFIFTDDLQWVKQNLDQPHQYIYVNAIGENADIEELHLMSLCNHHIIANSSYSWWGAWLNNKADKIVIGPKKWFNNQPTWDTKDLLPESWITT